MTKELYPNLTRLAKIYNENKDSTIEELMAIMGMNRDVLMNVVSRLELMGMLE